MALATTSAVLGSPVQYQMSSQAKKYTLRDVGFVPTRNGNFQLERPLDPNSPYSTSIKLKIMVSADLTKLQLSITSGNGLQSVNIFKDEKNKPFVEQYQFLIANLKQREVIEEVA